MADDWNNDDMLDIIIPGKVSRRVPAKTTWRRPFPDQHSANKTAVQAVATGDLNNDLRIDLVTLANGKVTVQFNGLEEAQTLSLAKPGATDLLLTDYDNDGWLDIFALGQGLQAFRNQGSAGFEDVTAALASTQ